VIQQGDTRVHLYHLPDKFVTEVYVHGTIIFRTSSTSRATVETATAAFINGYINDLITLRNQLADMPVTYGKG